MSRTPRGQRLIPQRFTRRNPTAPPPSRRLVLGAVLAAGAVLSLPRRAGSGPGGSDLIRTENERPGPPTGSSAAPASTRDEVALPLDRGLLLPDERPAGKSLRYGQHQPALALRVAAFTASVIMAGRAGDTWFAWGRSGARYSRRRGKSLQGLL